MLVHNVKVIITHRLKNIQFVRKIYDRIKKYMTPFKQVYDSESGHITMFPSRNHSTSTKHFSLIIIHELYIYKSLLKKIKLYK